jgi:hypothetical protein
MSSVLLEGRRNGNDVTISSTLMHGDSESLSFGIRVGWRVLDTSVRMRDAKVGEIEVRWKTKYGVS